MQMVLPDYATRFDSLSLSTCFLDLKGVGDVPRQATGFFWRHAGKVFLITNWHVVTGRNMMDGSAIGGGWAPERFEVQYFTKAIVADGAAMGLGADARVMDAPKFEISLYQDFHVPFWIQHPTAFEWNVDIVALELSETLLPDKSRVMCVNDRAYPRLYHFSGSEIFVLGYPLPQKENRYPAHFPVWKRGSIASEIIVPWNMRPAFLIDSRTSKGMSGSPVFAKVFGPAAHGDGTMHVDSIMTSEFMGVYSGRLFDDENNASIGLVWHRNLIDQMLAAPTAGSRDWVASKSIELFSTAAS
ncbi:hypothetical protein SAMN05216374_4229 [Tardiphaga sp. OK246]|uniref:S1 family peptidase n=1 Tax=Tardiphaga sp. OK246 TaxID=1855307 RepID=UPI000B6798AC|nr:serine protease [Tardiphaga sp. OK246]SNT49686.1 hypothetical protein SAMN05216374_4229 [Tardiphaga sp. OK246]